jgi:LacI family sucrose operon transcriptional repressor
MAKPKLSDVAKRAGVSATTVSRVLNNRGYLSAATKQAVHQAIDELGYRPNEIARSLLGQRTYLIGLIVPTVANPFFGELAAAIEGALATSGYKMLLCNSQGQAEQERAYLDLLQANQVDGIITSAHNDLIDGYAHATLPIVAVDRQMGAHIPNVRSDNAMGGRIATELLINQGCRSIVLVTATDSPQNARAGAYRTALKAAGIDRMSSNMASIRHGRPGRRDCSIGSIANPGLTACSPLTISRRCSRLNGRSGEALRFPMPSKSSGMTARRWSRNPFLA